MHRRKSNFDGPARQYATENFRVAFSCLGEEEICTRTHDLARIKHREVFLLDLRIACSAKTCRRRVFVPLSMCCWLSYDRTPRKRTSREVATPDKVPEKASIVKYRALVKTKRMDLLATNSTLATKIPAPSRRLAFYLI